MHVFMLGASRNIGYLVAQRLLAKGHTCTLLLRRPEAMESDSAMGGYISEGKLKIVRGDGLVEADVQRGWDAAKSDGEVDLVFSGIGGEPSLSLTQGFVVSPPDLTERSMSTLLSVIRKSTTPATRPKLVAISSNGLDDRTHSLLPLPMRVFYGWALKQPHVDKINLEKEVTRAAGWDGGNDEWLGAQNALIVQPALLTSGACKADKDANAYRIGQELQKTYTVSRADVAHFIAEKVVANWEQYAGKRWVVAY